tara:strand:- start:439 stop:1413 length:975 start_codon:yes stop_codon:yes gene_type:complete
MKKISKTKQLKLFFEMLRIREIERNISKNYKYQNMRCPIHLSVGQEAIAVGVCQNLTKKNKIVTAHRSHAHYLAKGGNLKSMLAEIHGKKTGCAMGKGGSMHLIDIKNGIEAAVPIVGSTIPIGTGIAWANKLDKQNNVVVIFFGDGATEEGAFFESLDFASLHNLQILFICENNFFSVYSDISKRQSKKRKISNISKALGINSHKSNGNRIEDIYLQVKKSLNFIKNKKRPYLIEYETFRHLEHCGPNYDDNLNYRSKKIIAKWYKDCPITQYESVLRNRKIINDSILNEMKQKILLEINKSFKFATESKYPEKKLLMKHNYA